jgi:hypothetical protein
MRVFFAFIFILIFASGCKSETINKNNTDSDSLLVVDIDIVDDNYELFNDDEDAKIDDIQDEKQDEYFDEQFEEDISESIDERDEENTDLDADILPESTGRTICTGQISCYNNTEEIPCPLSGENFSGQDAQYIEKCIPRSYAVSISEGDEIVADNNTGLMWQRTIPEIYAECAFGDPVGSMCSWQEAINYCNDLDYGGYDDWRLPSRIELESITDYGKSNPSIDTDLFIDTPVKWILTTTSFVMDSKRKWSVNQGVGTVGTRNQTDETYVRCVRGNAIDLSNFVEFAVEYKIIVKDLKTNFEWAKEAVSGGTWETVLNYCDNLEYAGYSDWRIPNVNELSTLFYDRAYQPASNFPGIYSEYYWTASTAVSANSSAWRINMFAGGVDLGMKSEKHFAMCVR